MIQHDFDVGSTAYTIPQISIQDTVKCKRIGRSEDLSLTDLIEVEEEWNSIFSKVGRVLMQWEMEFNQTNENGYDIQKVHDFLSKRVIFFIRSLKELMKILEQDFEDVIRLYAFEEIVKFNDVYIMRKIEECDALLNQARVLFNRLFGKTSPNELNNLNKSIISFYLKSFSIASYYLNVFHITMERERKMYEKRFDDENITSLHLSCIDKENEGNPFNRKIRIAILGDFSVGKRSIIERALFETFTPTKIHLHEDEAPLIPPSLGIYPPKIFHFDCSFFKPHKHSEESNESDDDEIEDSEEEEEEFVEVDLDDENEGECINSVINKFEEEARENATTKIEFQFITTPNYNSFVSIPPQSKRSWLFSDAVIFCFSIDSSESYENMLHVWMQEYIKIVEENQLSGHKHFKNVVSSSHHKNEQQQQEEDDENSSLRRRRRICKEKTKKYSKEPDVSGVGRNIPILIIGNKSDVELSLPEMTIHIDEWKKKKSVKKFYQLYGVEVNNQLDDLSGCWEDSFINFVEMYRNIKLCCGNLVPTTLSTISDNNKQTTRKKQHLCGYNDDESDDDDCMTRFSSTTITTSMSDQEEREMKKVMTEIEEEVDRLSKKVMEKHGGRGSPTKKNKRGNFNNNNNNKHHQRIFPEKLSGRQVRSENVISEMEYRFGHFFSEISCLSSENLKETIDVFLYQVASETGSWRSKKKFFEECGFPKGVGGGEEDVFFRMYQDPRSIVLDIQKGRDEDGCLESVGSCAGQKLGCFL